jgi:hypothetical protein
MVALAKRALRAAMTAAESAHFGVDFTRNKILRFNRLEQLRQCVSLSPANISTVNSDGNNPESAKKKSWK